MNNNAIELIDLGKKYSFVKTAIKGKGSIPEDFWALKNITVNIFHQETFGVIGRNGSGKTTLLNIIAGILSATKGECLVKEKVLGLFNLGTGFQDELTGRENIYLNGSILGADREEINDKIDLIVDFSELGDFINMPLGSYSQGMRLRLGFSIIASLDFDILVLDEILAVGDVLFQNKCFQRITELKRAGKTLIITSQDMGLIDRLCDRLLLLDHGKLVFYGNTSEGINNYQKLLSTEKFFVGPTHGDLVKNTKKWAEDISQWGKKLGTKEVVIDSVKFINKLGFECNRIKSKDSLKIRVNFTAKGRIKNPHFGVAIFRNDGVYCYGPNTSFDDYVISELKSGKGHFILDYHKLLLASGEYVLSVAIWDKNEAISFDYHNGCYKLIIDGDNGSKAELLKIPFKSDAGFLAKTLNIFRKNKNEIDLSQLADQWGKKSDIEGIRLRFVKLFDFYNCEKETFFTNEYVKLGIFFDEFNNINEGYYMWTGIYRDDKICCRSITAPIKANNKPNLVFPKLSLLPGDYRISIGIWDRLKREFLMCHHAVYPFKMVFDRQDHGTVYLEHTWSLSQ